MINSNIETLNTKTAFFDSWIEKQKGDGATLTDEHRKIIQSKTNILSKAQGLASQTREILLDLDNENYYNQSIEQESGSPILSTPVIQAKELASSGKTIALLGTLMQLSAEVNLSQLSAKLNGLMASYDSFKKTSDKFDKELDKLMNISESTSKEFELAQKLLDELGEQLQMLESQLSNKEQALSELTEKLATLSDLGEDSPEYQEVLNEIDTLKASILVNKQEITQKLQNIDEQKVIVKTKGLEAEQALKAASTALEKQQQHLQQGNNSVQNSSAQKQLTSAARLSELVAFFMQLVNKNSETELESQMSVFESMQKSVQEQMEKKAQEIEEQERKAAELQKTMGCIGKIIGAIVTVVSVAAAAFTGGASLALAGVGIALMATDYILEATTGQSLTDRIMAPFMEYVFLPLMNVIQKIIDNVLEYTPLGQLLNLIGELTGTDITGIAKTAVAALVTIAVIIAIAFVAKSLVKTVAEKLISTVVMQAIKNLVPKVMTSVVRNVSKTLVKNINQFYKKLGVKSESTAHKALQVEKLMRILSLGNQGAQVTGNIVVAEFRESAMRALASFKIAQFELENIKQVLESVMASFERSQSTYRDLAKLVSDSLHKETVSGKQVLNNMRV